MRNPAALKEQAPANYKARFDTSAGVFVVQVHRNWAPLGADRFYNLVKNGFYDDVRFFRVIRRTSWCSSASTAIPASQTIWRNTQLKDDPVKQSNKRGYITFATAGPNTRTTQVFINFRDNAALDKQGFAPFGQVVEGMDVVDKLYSGYEREARNSSARHSDRGQRLPDKEFPKLDYIKKATIEP